MEIPSHQKRKIIVGIIENEFCIVIKSRNDKWHFPDSFLDWEIGKKLGTPIKTASTLLKNAMLSTLEFNESSERKKLPSGGFFFKLEFQNLETSVKIVQKLKKFHFRDLHDVELVKIEELLEVKSYEKFEGSTIEAARLLREK